MQKVFVHIEQPTPRASYIIGHVLRRMLGWEPVILLDRGEFNATDGLKLHYGIGAQPGALNIHPDGLLLRSGKERMEPVVIDVAGMPALFPVAAGDLPFDPFSAAFWLLTRMEELVGIPEDEHGRPMSTALHAARHGYLDRPVVDHWAIWLAERWRNLDPRVPVVQRRYSHVFTMDVDNGFAYLGRSWWRIVGAQARAVLSGHREEADARRAVVSGLQRDPFDIYDDLKGWTEGLADRRIVFWLLAERGRYDHGISPDDPLLRERMSRTSTWTETGIHPSYSSQDDAVLRNELDAFASVIGRPARLARQHFLRLGLPSTYETYERHGIMEDHSMGLHDALGFRAGTCTPFKFYDAANDRELDLEVWPHTVMDNTLRDKLRLSPMDGMRAARAMVDKVRAVKGTFIGLWHESFLSDHLAARGWRDAILEITRYAKP